MPSPFHSLMLVLPIILVATLSMGTISPVTAMASPRPLPMPLRAVDYSGHFAPIAHATRHNNVLKKSHVPIRYMGEHAKPSTQFNNSVNSARLTTVHRTVRASSAFNAFRALRRDNSVDMSELSSRRDAVVKSSNEMSSLASQSDGDRDSNFQQDAATALSNHQTSMTEFISTYKEVATDKGLANYDNSIELETLLKDVVNANKNVMAAVAELIDGIPVLGPILAPMVYDIKCLVDDLLDATEDLSDVLMNALKPLLVPLNPTLTAVMQALGLPI
ncbi:hypothetical protein EW145_g4318 [Phellinidium pouzarii]|uniref:Uncharacterized protein n=1 Tax=Phellinidium pouzarii TaxID=167371 RepID=A0A4S4L4H0_9AGAM|nr:hypothetical protein EW145_g4318 [Phellinidium pouzarii]